MLTAYLMESTDEAARLEQKTSLEFARQNLELAGLRRGMRGVDVGCGVGVVTRVMHTISGSCKTLGVDRSVERIQAARQACVKHGGTIEFIRAEADDIPVAAGSYDFSWSRFLFEYLEDPAAALREMIRITRKDGIVAVADLDAQMTQFYPQSESTAAGLAEACRILSGAGLDANIGRKLFALFRSSALRDIKVWVVPYQTYVGGLDAPAQMNWQLKLQAATRRLENLAPFGQWQALAQDVMAQLMRDDSFYYSTLIIATGVKGAGR